MDAIEWKDEYRRDPDHVVLTRKMLGIPGIQTLGWMNKHGVHESPKSHYHRDCFEIAFVMSGKLRLYCAGREYPIMGGDAFITAPDEVHGTDAFPYEPCELFWIQLNTKDKDFLYLSDEAANHLKNKLYHVEDHYISTNEHSIIRNLRKLLDSVLDERSYVDTYQAAVEFTQLLYHILSFAHITDSRVSLEISDICNYIQMHLRERIAVEQLARLCNRSLSGFKHKFKEETGISPGNYITRCKIEEIKNVISIDTNMTELSGQYGFATSSHFSNTFKKLVGMTPSEYAKGKGQQQDGLL